MSPSGHTLSLVEDRKLLSKSSIKLVAVMIIGSYWTSTSGKTDPRAIFGLGGEGGLVVDLVVQQRQLSGGLDTECGCRRPPPPLHPPPSPPSPPSSPSPPPPPSPLPRAVHPPSPLTPSTHYIHILVKIDVIKITC